MWSIPSADCTGNEKQSVELGCRQLAHPLAKVVIAFYSRYRVRRRELNFRSFVTSSRAKITRLIVRENLHLMFLEIFLSYHFLYLQDRRQHLLASIIAM